MTRKTIRHLVRKFAGVITPCTGHPQFKSFVMIRSSNRQMLVCLKIAFQRDELSARQRNLYNGNGCPHANDI